MRDTDPILLAGHVRALAFGRQAAMESGSAAIAFGLTVRGVAFDSNQQPLVQNGEDARQDGDRRDVRSVLELGDERVRRPGALSDLSLGELELVGQPRPGSPLSNMKSCSRRGPERSVRRRS